MSKSKTKRSGPGRPPVNPPGMTARKAVRLWPREDADWTALAANEGRSFSDWARRMIRKGLGLPMNGGSS